MTRVAPEPMVRMELTASPTSRSREEDFAIDGRDDSGITQVLFRLGQAAL